MSLYAASKEKPVDNFLTSLIEAYPDASMRDIAVLFTDVVGSTSFFKTHGDIRGREMLRTHHHMATSVVEEYGGALIKEVGDSILAYFPDPVEALKAAIKMQHEFRLHNNENSAEEAIHVRIGLHHGRVIVEEKDIYGDVVNVAAKLTNLAGGDQIFISHEVYETTKDAPLIQFERIDFWNMKNVPDGLSIYRVIWENADARAPSRKILMVLVPDPLHPEIRSIVDAADLSRGQEDDPPGDECLSVTRSQDDKPVFVYATTPAAIQASRRILSRLAEKGTPPGTVLPVKIYITGASARDEEALLTNGPGTDLDDLPYGGIYVSLDVCQQMRSHQRVAGETPLLFEPAGPLFKISGQQGREATPESPLPETIAPAAQGAYSPCFYCGSTRHKMSNCPSRTLTETGKSIHHLGYFPMQAIEDLALSIERSPVDIELGGNLSSTGTAPTGKELIAHAFYDIRSVFQLRFSQILWNSKADSWDSLSLALTENQGGFAWLAQDSLRVSNYDKARSFLKLALERKPQDYSAFCVSGFLNMEVGDIPAAISDLKKALEFAHSTIRKVYASLILARLYKLSGDLNRFRVRLSATLLLDRSCRQAIYEDVINRFEEKDEKSAIKKLVKLIRDDDDFFVIALIDPALAPYRNTIYAHLTELLTEAKKDALSHFEDARKEFGRCRSLLPPSALKTIEPVLRDIEGLVRSESYFGCLEVPHRCGAIGTMCRNAINEQSQNIAETMKGLRARFESADAFLKAYRYSHLAEKHRRRLSYLKRSLEKTGDVRYFESSGEFESCYHMCQDISSQLASLESRLEVLDLSAHIIRMCLKFLKYTAVFFSIVFFIEIFMFPLMSDQINTALARMDISLFPNAWSLQKAFLIFGGITSLIAAFLMTVREVFTGDAR